MQTRALVLCAALSAAVSGLAQAGAASGNVGGTLNITDTGGYSATLDLGSLLGVDASTGNIVVNTGAVRADATGNWVVQNNSSDANQIRVYDAQTDSYFVPAQVVRWNSWTRADGSVAPNTPTDPANPWRSVLTFFAGGNIDPYISYGISVRNNTAFTQTYSYSQGQTLAPAINDPYTVYADISGSLVNNPTFGAPAALSGLSGAKVQSVLLGNGGVASTNAGVDVGNPLSHSGVGSTTYGTFAASSAGAGSYDWWSINASFTLTPGDVATLSGYAEIMPIPEPGTYAMFFAGIAVIGFMLRRRGNPQG